MALKKYKKFSRKKRERYTRRITLPLTILLVNAIVLLPVISFAFENEPHGFRGIGWWTSISKLKSVMEHERTDPSYGGIEMYTRKGDEPQIGSANLKSIEYGFWRGKFTSVIITTKGN